MKKLLPLFILIALISCRQEDIDLLSDSVPEEVSSVNTLSSSSLRTLEQITNAAEDAYYNFLGKSKGRGVCHVSGIKPVMISNSRSESGSDSILYAVNFEEGGYAILTSVKSVYPLIALIEDGEYNESSVLENPGMSMFLLAAKDSIRDLINPWEELRQCKDTTIIYKYEYGPLVTVNWGQKCPEGLLCPNKVSGCANTALAMAMSYYCEPNSILLEFGEYQGSTLVLDWDEIKQHNHRDNYFPSYECNVSDEIHLSISKLCRQLGVRTRSTYNIASDSTMNSTSTTFTRLHGVAKDYLLNHYISDIFSYKSPIWCPGGIMIMCGTSSTSKVGHAWIKDGHSWIVTRYEHYEKGPLDPVFVLTYSSESEVHYSHINWGWDGSNNGYFADGLFNTTQGHPFDYTDINTTAYDFDTNIKYFYIK